MFNIEDLLKRVVKLGGSDLHFKVDTGKVYVRILGELRLFDDVAPFTPEEFKAECRRILRKEQWEWFERDLELDFAYELPGISRFRGNLYIQRETVQAAFRVIPYEIQSMEDLMLPEAAHEFIQRPRGLVLVTGPAGSGKSTTLAAMIDRLNRTTAQHIITVEDPVEFVHDDHMALLNQRELNNDTLSFANALKYVLRQDPDVILVGEMRDLETIHLAITAAETGHLVFATLHTVDAVQTVDRIVDVFPTYQQQQVRMQLSVNLVGVVSQSLVKRKDGRGRAAAFEILVGTSAVRNLIRENKSYQINSIIQTGHKQKMQTLDQSLLKLVERGVVSYDDARMKAKDRFEFERMAASIQGGIAAVQGSKAVGSSTQMVGPQAADFIPEIAAHPPQQQNGPVPPPPGVTPPPAPPPVQQGGVRGQPNRPQIRRDDQ